MNDCGLALRPRVAGSAKGFDRLGGPKLGEVLEKQPLVGLGAHLEPACHYNVRARLHADLGEVGTGREVLGSLEPHLPFVKLGAKPGRANFDAMGVVGKAILPTRVAVEADVWTNGPEMLQRRATGRGTAWDMGRGNRAAAAASAKGGGGGTCRRCRMTDSCALTTTDRGRCLDSNSHAQPVRAAAKARVGHAQTAALGPHTRVQMSWSNSWLLKVQFGC